MVNADDATREAVSSDTFRETTRKASTASAELRARVENGAFAVALSGGGTRAALFAVGGLLALVDRGLGEKILQVASVSGGSITNAYVAKRCNLAKLRYGDLDPIVKDLTTTIIKDGLLTEAWIGALVAGVFLFGVLVPTLLGAPLAMLLTILAGVFAAYHLLRFVGVAALVVILAAARLLAGAVVGVTLLTILAGVLCALAAYLLTGLVVEWLIDRRLFRSDSSRRAKRTTLESISDGEKPDHVICATDLVLGLPVYASVSSGGMIWRRLTPQRPDWSKYQQFQTFNARGSSLAEWVRASAAFPGIPPRRIRFPPDPSIALVPQLPDVGFVADGGLWNNLGSQALREDYLLGTYTAWDNGVKRPLDVGVPGQRIPLLCVNASAPLSASRPTFFWGPGIAQVSWLSRYLNIQNTNTVLPRVEAMRKDFAQREPKYSPGKGDVDLVVDMRCASETRGDYLEFALNEDLIRSKDPAVKEWERQAAAHVRSALKNAITTGGAGALDLALVTPEPPGAFPVVGWTSIGLWQALWKSQAWKDLIKTDQESGPIKVSTTLSRIDPRDARQLILRGYLNTYLASLFLAPLSQDDLANLGALSKRLDDIAPTGRNP
jgi:predicted acylesterase/phospholipase RssA